MLSSAYSFDQRSPLQLTIIRFHTLKRDAQAEKIAIVAHSYGGVVVVDLVDRLGMETPFVGCMLGSF